MNTPLNLRAATPADAPTLHRLIAENVEAGHLLPRTLDEIAAHAGRFVVADGAGGIVGCAELAPLSGAVAEVRSLVVDGSARGHRIGPRLVSEVATAARARGFAALCAFTHDPAPFVRLGFTLVPHTWVPEKIARDCTACALFRRCGQYAVTLPLRPTATIRPEQPAALIYGGRAVPGRRPTVERLHLRPSSAAGEAPEASEAIPA